MGLGETGVSEPDNLVEATEMDWEESRRIMAILKDTYDQYESELEKRKKV